MNTDSIWDDAITKAKESPNRQLQATNQERILIAFTTTDCRAPLSVELCKKLGAMQELQGLWTMECLVPFPLVSRSIDEDVRRALQAVSAELSPDRSLRSIVVAGNVEYGGLGGVARFSYGSTGRLVFCLCKAVADLPLKENWVHASAKQLLNVTSDRSERVDGEEFWRFDYPLAMPESE